ncbi:cyclase family protein [Maribacter sp. MJ134]|uniref:cyclase family protein n=1 Tax=Maribacter sp. MJ134 TaxID=2496865 RepID=UPI000F84C436|nr:cyclase family protein [Maribacter sp. MJ134]AZQ59186.1 cyclase family protein [Maribacter sp. MJ134]
MMDLIGKNVIDLTLTLSDKMKGVSITEARSLAKDGWNASTLELYSHVGTHMDAPLHFEVTQQSIDEISVARFISEAWVVNLSHIAPSAMITVSDMSPIANKIKKGQSLILQTDWSKRVDTKSYRDELPRISKELALWMGKKGIGLLGVEPPSVADVNNLKEVTEIHTILMQNDIIIVEGLTNLDSINKEQVTLIALPLKVLRGDGAPARVLALE